MFLVFFGFGGCLFSCYFYDRLRSDEKGKTGFTSFQFRLFNEVPTLFLVIIVSIAIFKNATNPLILLLSILGFVIFLVVMTKVYKRIRDKNEQT